MRHSFGLLGTLGVILLVVWFVGWMFFNVPGIHVLFPIGVFACLAQWVRRVAA
ncbi:MAG TPA: hypothetical protein VHQ45_11395 [Gemmatimonadaceae bacterium]|jgi:hypothetical protein|nr:hypothetical protein [Gemmatimonadaceae bacterium]